MFKTFLLSFAFLLLQINTYAVGSDGNIANVSSILKKEKKGILRKFQERLILKKINKFVDTIDYDLITLHEGEDIMAYVLNFDQDHVYFNRYGNLGSEVDTLSCEDVDIVYLTDGTRYGCTFVKNGMWKNYGKFKKITSEERKEVDLSCDIISLNNGQEIHVNILEIQNEKILFKTCSQPLSDTDSLTCKEIEFILLADGTEYACSHKMFSSSSKSRFYKKPSKDVVKANLECDILVMMNKDQLAVNIVEIKDRRLYYKTCGDDSAPIESVRTTDLRTYLKKNGFSKRIHNYPNEKGMNKYRSAGYHGVLSFFKVVGLALLSIIVLSIIFEVFLL